MFHLRALVLLAAFSAAIVPATAQPRLGEVDTSDPSEWASDEMLSVWSQSPPGMTYLRWPNAAGQAVAVVDGRRTTLRPVGRGRMASAFDRDAGVTRHYEVSTFRSADRSVDVELWLRDTGYDGGDCRQQIGWMTVRKRGHETYVRVHACRF